MKEEEMIFSFCEVDEDVEIEKPELELEDLGLFDENYNQDDEKEIWKYIKNNDIKELEKYLFLQEANSPKSNYFLCLKAIVSYLNKDKEAPKIMIQTIKNVNYKNSNYFEFLIFIADRLKEFHSNKNSIMSIDSYIVQSVIYLKKKDFNFYGVFKIVCKSVFYLVQNANLNDEERKELYIILYNFLDNFEYSHLNKEDYKIYLRCYTKVLWGLKDEFPEKVKKFFLPLFEGIIFQSMILDNDEEKIIKLSNYGIDKEVAKELVILYEV